MPEGNATIDITQIVDEQNIGVLVVRIVFLTFLVQLADGYDLAAMSYAAPAMVHAWHFKPSDLGPLFSASLVGMLFGAPLLGYAGDRFGRRQAIIWGTITYAVASLGMLAAGNFTALLTLRFVCGIGLGGVMPNTIALNAEFAPKRLRATLIILMFMGVTVGGALPALVSSGFERSFGWESYFVVGGVVPLAIAVALYFYLPESIKFLSLHKRGRSQVLRLARALRPDLVIPAEAEFLIPASRDEGGVLPVQLFRNGMHWITPLVWFLFVASLMANFFLNNWMPTLFRARGFSVDETSVTQASYYVGGVLGGLVTSRLLDRWGIMALVVLFVLGCPVVAAIGLPAQSHWTLTFTVFMAGFSLLGIQLGLNAVSGLIYPTAIRSKGAGWMHGIGRFGAISAPLIGGWLITLGFSQQALFSVPSASLGIGVVAAVVLARFCNARFKGSTLGELAIGKPIAMILPSECASSAVALAMAEEAANSAS
jgi:AAHS family 4-hydroxybenzoate transporter-like MFS transporter